MSLNLYKSYNFRDKDPIIYMIWDAIKHIPFRKIEKESGVRVQTLHNWFYGTTKRPQAASIRAVLRSQGLDLTITKTVYNITKKPPDMTKPVRTSRTHVVRVIEGGKKVAPKKRRL